MRRRGYDGDYVGCARDGRNVDQCAVRAAIVEQRPHQRRHAARCVERSSHLILSAHHRAAGAPSSPTWFVGEGGSVFQKTDSSAHHRAGRALYRQAGIGSGMHSDPLSFPGPTLCVGARNLSERVLIQHTEGAKLTRQRDSSPPQKPPELRMTSVAACPSSPTRFVGEGGSVFQRPTAEV